MKKSWKEKNRAPVLPQQANSVSSGIDGLDRIMHGGYSEGRTTLIRGASGSGKTLFSLMFASAREQNNEAVVFASFDEPIEHLEQYVNTWGQKNHITFLDFTIDPEITKSGDDEIDLGGILIRLELALKKTKAKYLILDAFDVLFSTFHNSGQIRWQLSRIFHWCRQQGVTLVATAGIDPMYEASTDTLDYGSDCTILLTQKMDGGLMTRRLRILKLRGRGHGTNEYPFLIDYKGISVLPVTDTAMSSKVYRKRLSTGIEKLDKMLGGKGIWQGSTVMISGQSGSGKSLVSANLAAHACKNGLRVLYISFEEAPTVFIRDVRSAGIHLKPHVESGQCKLIGRRPVEIGMEEQVILLLRNISDFKPDITILDPISSLADLADQRDFKNAVLRLCHSLKEAGVTTVISELLPDDAGGVSRINVSSLVDTWIRLFRKTEDNVMTRYISVHKSRGAATSNQVQQFEITRKGFIFND